MYSRREVLRIIKCFLFAQLMRPFNTPAFAQNNKTKITSKEPVSMLFRSINGSPEKNLNKVIELMGGIEAIVGSDDVVVIKPNIQWWNQGAPNLSALKAFVDLIMNHPKGFRGEVVIAENCHRNNTPWESMKSGWAKPFELNVDLPNIFNANQLCASLKKQYGQQFTTCYWIDVASGGKRVYGPADGSGYVYCDGSGGVPLISFDNGLKGEQFREVIMSYPIFKTDKGTLIDFKNGIWEKGAYTEQPLRFINFAALNHHSRYSGPTSAIKNFFGITDISGGPEGQSKNDNGGILCGNYYNFHQFPYNTWEAGPVPGMMGAEVGVFLKTIRKPDLNITTAEWIGLISRIYPPISRTRAVLASTDPVALDYHATKYVLFPNSQIPIHNPDNMKGPLYHDLKQCADQSGFVFDEKHVAVKSYDFQKQTKQDARNLVVSGKMRWGYEPKILMKYMAMRFLGGA